MKLQGIFNELKLQIKDGTGVRDVTFNKWY